MTKPWKKISEEPVPLGYRKVLRRVFELPDGKQQEFNIINAPRCVCMFALTADNQVVLAEQFRPGPEKVLLEMPGGGVHEGEDPQEAAIRELIEETGYTGDIQFIGTSIDDAYNNMIRYNYVFTNCQKTHEQALDESEFIEPVLMSLADFRAHLRSGEFTDVEAGYLALDFLNLL